MFRQQMQMTHQRRETAIQNQKAQQIRETEIKLKTAQEARQDAEVMAKTITVGSLV